MRGIAVASLAFATSLTLWAAPPAEATLPGSNGLIAFVAGGEIYAMNPDGSDVIQLTDGPKDKLWPAWNGDGSMLALTVYSPRAGSYQIGTAAADGSGLVTFDAPRCNFFDPSWAPDGTQIAFFGYCNTLDRVWIADADGTARTKFTHIQALFPTWSPDGTQIAFVHRTAIGRRFRTDIYVQDLATGVVSQLTVSRDYEADLDWSPDGTSILFAAFDGIYTVALDGSGRTRLTTGDLGEVHLSPTWSPDGSKVLFARLLDTDGDFEGDAGQIWSIDPDGGNPVQLSPDNLLAEMPAWQPV